LIPTGSANLGAIPSQMLFQFLSIQAMRYPEEVQHDETAAREKAAFTEDLNTPVLI